VIKLLLAGQHKRDRWSKVSGKGKDVFPNALTHELSRFALTLIVSTMQPFSTLSSFRDNQLVAKIAMTYSDQVKLDFGCFVEYVKKNFR
jgi:hypothetical protein